MVLFLYLLHITRRRKVTFCYRMWPYT